MSNLGTQFLFMKRKILKHSQALNFTHKTRSSPMMNGNNYSDSHKDKRHQNN